VKNDETKSGERAKDWFLRITGHLVILLQSTPLIWAGLMTFPLFGLLIVLIGGAPSGIYPNWFIPLISSPTIQTAIFDLGFIIWIYSVFYLFFAKKKGLVTSGIYRYIRHPQYLGAIMFTSTLTAGSWWILLNTFGISYVSAEETIILWFLMVLGYIGLALAEEHYLVDQMGDEYRNYLENSSFILPYVKISNKVLNMVIVFLFSAVILYFQMISITPEMFF